MELLSIPLKAPALTRASKQARIAFYAMAFSATFAWADSLKSYENFGLPANPHNAGPQGPISYITPRVQVKGSVRMNEPGVNHQQIVFAREAFLAEKRDEAIKLLRQELDSNFKKNRDNILLRLGQLYTEKYMELSYRENEYFGEQLAQFEKQKLVDKKTKAPKLDNGRSQAYLKQALEVFTSIEKEFPRHPKIDEVTFFIGFVEMEYGNGDRGSRYLEKLIHSYPKSHKFEEAILYLGDHYFDQAKFRDALGRYRILVNRRESPLYHYALYKQAWCELNTNEENKALSDMKEVISGLTGSKEVAKFNLREQALKDIVLFFAEVERVNEAVEYFTATVGKEKALENLRLIADIMRSKAHDEGAMKAYQRLLVEFGDSLDAPKIQLGLVETQARIGKTQESIKNLVNAVERFSPDSEWSKKFSAEKPAEVKAAQDEVSSEAQKVAFFYHQSAQKSSNKSSFQHALELYNVLLKYFPQHPERKKIAFYRGEILFNQGDWFNAANSYMEAAKTPPKDKIADEAAYYAVLSLDKLTLKSEKIQRYSKDEQKKIDLTPEEIPANEKRFLEVADYYIKEYPTAERIVDVKFRIASIYYRFHHFDTAQNLLKEIALKYPKHRSATTAANIVLDIYNMKKEYDQLDVTANLFAHTEGLGDASFKAEMAALSGQVGFKKIESFEANNKWKEAGDSYLNFYRNNPTGPLAEKSLYNAFVSYEKAGDVAKASEASRLFVAKFPKSEYSQKLSLNLAKLAEKQYDFETAQTLYQDYYRKFPKDKEARKALYNAAVFAELLEKNTAAITLYEDYLKNRDVTQEEKKAIHISEAKIYRKQGNWDKVTVIYRRMIREARSQDEKLKLLAELARQYEKGGKVTERTAILNEIRYMYDGVKGKKEGGLAVQYAAEARFRAVASKREKYEKVELRFPPQDLVYLLKRKQRLLTQLAAAYDEVVEFGVPEWGVAALYEKSDAYENFVRTYRAVKVPAKMKGPEKEEAEAALKQIDAQIVKPVENRGQEIIKACVDRAAQFYVVSEYAAKCREKLQKTGNEVEPSGLIPQPSYWTTRWVGEGVARQ